MSGDDPISETAGAVKAVAKTTEKAIETANRLGGFIANVVAGPLEQGVGIWEDRLKYMRWERQVRFVERAQQLMREMGVGARTRPIPLNIAIPLFEGASLSESDHLQDLWARLLVNSIDENSNVNIQRAYIEILDQLTPLEAKILETVYSIPYEETRHDGIITAQLPDAAEKANDTNRDTEPSDDVKLALSNLVRLRCVAAGMSWGGGEIFTRITPTLLGKKFIEACTIRVQAS